jgi:hypothetical protein
MWCIWLLSGENGLFLRQILEKKTLPESRMGTVYNTRVARIIKYFSGSITVRIAESEVMIYMVNK